MWQTVAIITIPGYRNEISVPLAGNSPASAALAAPTAASPAVAACTLHLTAPPPPPPPSPMGWCRRAARLHGGGVISGRQARWHGRGVIRAPAPRTLWRWRREKSDHLAEQHRKLVDWSLALFKFQCAPVTVVAILENNYRTQNCYFFLLFYLCTGKSGVRAFSENKIRVSRVAVASSQGKIDIWLTKFREQGFKGQYCQC